MTRYWFPKPYADIVMRLRVPSGFVLLLGFVWLARPTLTALWMGMPVSLAGLSLRAWAAGHLAKNQQLAASGPYAYTRNPLYLGTLLVAAGLVVASQSWVLAALLSAVFLLVYVPVMEQEEQHLRKLFPGYAAYADRVPLLLPRGQRLPHTQRFSFALYRKNEEFKAALAYGVAVALLAWRSL